MLESGHDSMNGVFSELQGFSLFFAICTFLAVVLKPFHFYVIQVIARIQTQQANKSPALRGSLTGR